MTYGITLSVHSSDCQGLTDCYMIVNVDQYMYNESRLKIK